MDFARQVTACLHREHLESLALLEAVEAVLAKAKAPPPAGDAVWRLMGRLEANLANEVGRHFAFEEEQLFPLMGGDQDIAQLLADEHKAILALAQRLMPFLRGEPVRNWAEFRALALELVERQVGHIQKEEMSLLPVLEDALDSEQDAELLSRYLATA